jgi:hypothetical protein
MIDARISDALRRECLATSQDLEGGVASLTVAERITQVLCLFPPTVMQAPVEVSNSEDRAHDAYFRVGRLENDASLIFVGMILRARLLLLQDVDETPVSLATERLDCIDQALSLLLDHVLGALPGCYAGVSLWQTRGKNQAAMGRWVRGHQIFAALTQGLIFTFHSLDRAMRIGDSLGISDALDLAVCILEGSGAAFEFTGDFTPDEYVNTIRPSMMPPIALEALSGTMSIDHRCLVQLMREMKPTLNALRVRDKVRHARLAQALSDVYDSHKYVCSRFVGIQRSLIMAESSQKTGVDLIEQFKKMRMKVFEPTSAPRKETLPVENLTSGHPPG